MSGRNETTNNFDLVRVLAAAQVLLGHAVLHLKIEPALPSWLGVLHGAFPGIHIFFVVSGFLISRSWERTPHLPTYVRSRALRIYPALWAAFFVALGLLGYAGELDGSTVGSKGFFAWLVAQLTIAQFWNPDFFRSFGTGVVNGSLWTIAVEIGFYVIIPVLYRTTLDRVSRRAGNVVLALLALASYLTWWNLPPDASTPLLKLIGVSPLPHLDMFLLGVIAQRNFDRLKPLLAGRMLWWSIAYVGFVALAWNVFGDTLRPNVGLAVAGRVLLAAWTISFAYSAVRWSGRILRGNDLSYGLYLHHMLVVNLFLHQGWTGTWSAFGAAASVALGLAALSWHFVEKPALTLKSARPTPVAVAT